MKKLLLTFVLCLLIAPVFAQTQTITYYNKGYVKLLTEEGAYYVDHTETNSSGGGTRTRYLKEKKVKISVYTFSSFEGESQKDTLDGEFSVWHTNGNLSEKGTYKKNELHGKVSTWFDNGQLSYEKFYVNGKLQGTLKGYYKEGAVRRIEEYKAGEMVEGKVFSIKGEALPYYPAVVLPKYPGGEKVMMAYISGNVRYPEEAIEMNISGLVLVSFIVDKDGSIKTPEIIKSVSEALDKEALRVVKSMPRWEPGLYENEIVPVRFTLPVRFAFQDEL